MNISDEKRMAFEDAHGPMGNITNSAKQKIA